MTFAAIALLAALGAPTALQAEGPGTQSRAEVRVLTFDGPGGKGTGLDADQNGTVSREEFSAPMTTAFDRLDADHDGRLTTEELAAGPGPEGMGTAGPYRVMMDGHGGPMTFHIGDDARVMTIRQGGPAGGPPPGPGERRIEIRRFGGPGGSDQMDTNKDGRITEDEFLAPMRDAFRAMDDDGDGTIDAARAAAGPPPPPPPAD